MKLPFINITVGEKRRERNSLTRREAISDAVKEAKEVATHRAETTGAIAHLVELVKTGFAATKADRINDRKEVAEGFANAKRDREKGEAKLESCIHDLGERLDKRDGDLEKRIDNCSTPVRRVARR